MAFRTKKISQMDPKGSNLASTDLLEISELVSGSYVTKSITGQEIIDSIPAPPSGITIGTTAITSGTVGRVLFEGTGNVVSQSANLFWDNTNGRLGIGTSSPSAIIHSVGSVTASSAIGRGNYLQPTLVASANSDVLVGLDIAPTFTNGAFTGVSNLLLRASIGGTPKATITTLGDLILNGVTGANSPSVSVFTSGTSAYFQNYYNATDNALYWQSVGSYHNATKMVFRNFQQNTGFAVFSTGNTVFGGNPATVTDAGYKLDVNGTARVQTSLVINGSSSLFSSALTIYQNASNRIGSLSLSTNKADTTTRTHLSLNSSETSTPQSLDFQYVGASLINDRYNLLQTSEVGVAYGGGLVLQRDGGWVGIGSGTQFASAICAITSTTKGFLPPRLTTTQKNAIASPATGLVVFDSTLNKLCVRGASAWETITSL